MTDNQEQKMILDIVARIKQEAKRQKIAMSDLATEVEMTKTGFYRTLESGSMKVSTLIKIAKSLKIDLSTLVGNETSSMSKDCEEIKKELTHVTQLVEAQKTIIELLQAK